MLVSALQARRTLFFSGVGVLCLAALMLGVAVGADGSPSCPGTICIRIMPDTTPWEWRLTSAHLPPNGTRKSPTFIIAGSGDLRGVRST